jgi:MFS family permease
MVADGVEHVIGYWLLWELTHSPFWLGYAVFAHWLPFLFCSLHAGAWADRFDNRRLLQASQALYVFCSAALGLLAITGQLQLWHMVVLLLVHGFAGVLQMPSSQVLIHDLVGRDSLPNALSLVAGSRYVAQFLGPMVGGALLWVFGSGGGLLLNVLIYLPFTLALLTIHPARATPPVRDATRWRSILEGLRFVRHYREVLGLTLLGAIPAALLGNAFQAAMPALAAELGTGQAGYTWLLSANGIGAVAGAALLGYFGHLERKGLLVCAATLAWGGLLLGFAASGFFWLSFGIMLLVGAATIAANALGQTLVQELSPEDKRGRVMGVYATGVHGSRTLSGLLLGGLAALLGAHLAVGILAAATVLAVGALLTALPSLRDLD